MLQFVGWTSGMCVMPMIAWATGGEWKLFMVLSSVPCAAVFLAFRSVTSARPSIQWLYSPNRALASSFEVS